MCSIYFNYATQSEKLCNTFERNFATVEHKGEKVEAVVRKKAKSISDLAERMGYDRASLYRHFKDAELSNALILEYAKALKYDFSKEFPDLYSFANTLHEPLEQYRPLTLSDALKEVDYWKTKYITLLEIHNDLLKSMLNNA